MNKVNHTEKAREALDNAYGELTTALESIRSVIHDDRFRARSEEYQEAVISWESEAEDALFSVENVLSLIDS